MILRSLTIFVLATGLAASALGAGLFWPPPPDPPRVEHLDIIEFDALKPSTSWLGRLARLLGGNSKSDRLSLPFDLVAVENHLFVVCQNIDALVEIDPAKNEFKLHRCDASPLQYPVAVCDGGDGRVLVSDPEAAAVYIFDDGQLRPLITENLVRPTGITALPAERRIYVVDTGDHTLKVFDYSGVQLVTVTGDQVDSTQLHFPTFAASFGTGELFVNDALNYKIRRYDADGNHLGAFGREGDGVGCFARPKGLAVDSERHLYVVDNLMDNVQVFDPSGRLLLVIGGRGSRPGQFWSPAGIAVENDTIYVADTFNDRIQIFRYLGGGE